MLPPMTPKKGLAAAKKALSSKVPNLDCHVLENGMSNRVERF